MRTATVLAMRVFMRLPAGSDVFQRFLDWGRRIPASTCPTWTLFDNGLGAHPYMSGETLVIPNTSVDSEYFFFEQGPVQLSQPSTLVVESRMRRLSGSSSVNYRDAAGVSVMCATDTVNELYIGADEIFLLSDPTTKGPSALVDTDNQYHTYRIIVNPNRAIDVFYDGVLTLTGNMFYWSAGPGPRIGFGDISRFSGGESHWLYLQHNAYAFATDADSDGILDSCDGRPDNTNPGQEDADGDGTGDACEPILSPVRGRFGIGDAGGHGSS